MMHYWIMMALLLHLNPSIDERDAHVLAANLATLSPDPCLSIAIGMQESSLRNVEGKTRDYGYFQLTRHAMAGHTKEEILADVGLQVVLHLEHLKEKKKQCKHLDSEWWTCYHSKTPKFRLKYRDMVNKYRRQLDVSFGETCKRLTAKQVSRPGASPESGGGHRPQPPSTTTPRR